jgi:hypothetical protein
MDRKIKLITMIIIAAMLIVMFSPISFATEPKGTLVVTYDDGEITTTDNRIHPSLALHFDVNKTPGALAESAVLTLADGTQVFWEYKVDGTGKPDGSEDNPFWQGSENADLNGYETGYWHWIFTPSGILTISNSSGEGMPEYGKLTIIKFYDANANGVFDEGEEEIPGWKVKIWIGDIYYGCVETPYEITDLPYGTEVTVEEMLPSSGTWMATTDIKVTETIDAENDDATVEFGNVCLGAGGGYTIGFWTNKNGENVFKNVIGEESALAALRELNLKDAAGKGFNPTDYTGFRSWLRGADAENMQYMLSAQLAAMKLNTMWYDATDGDEGVNKDGLIYDVTEDRFISIEDLMDEANAALADTDAERSYQEYLKDLLDSANNNEYIYVQDSPCYFEFDSCDENSID